MMLFVTCISSLDESVRDVVCTKHYVSICGRVLMIFNCDDEKLVRLRLVLRSVRRTAGDSGEGVCDVFEAGHPSCFR